MDKDSFWKTLEITDQTSSLGNSAAHRLHHLKVSFYGMRKAYPVCELSLGVRYTASRLQSSPGHVPRDRLSFSTVWSFYVPTLASPL
jgi:hypothetical protein